jgi:hypothetical protein
MTSFSLHTPDTAPLNYSAIPSPARPLSRPLRNRWSHGRGYAVIALLAPVVLASLALVYVHNSLRLSVALLRLRLR